MRVDAVIEGLSARLQVFGRSCYSNRRGLVSNPARDQRTKGDDLAPDNWILPEPFRRLGETATSSTSRSASGRAPV